MTKILGGGYYTIEKVGRWAAGRGNDMKNARKLLALVLALCLLLGCLSALAALKPLTCSSKPAGLRLAGKKIPGNLVFFQALV